MSTVTNTNIRPLGPRKESSMIQIPMTMNSDSYYSQIQNLATKSDSNDSSNLI